jgi:hypothetical protein
MKNTLNFYFKLPKSYVVFFDVLGMIIFVLTLGLGFKWWYDIFVERRYWLNKKLLLKYLNESLINFDSVKLLHFTDINIYELKFDIFNIWYYEKHKRFTLDLGKGHADLVGLFTSVKASQKLNSKITKYFDNAIINGLNTINDDKN